MPCELLATVAPPHPSEHWGGQRIVAGVGRSHHACQHIKVAALLWFDTRAKNKKIKKENRKSHIIFDLGLNVASWENRWMLKRSQSLRGALCCSSRTAAVVFQVMQSCLAASPPLRTAVHTSSWVTQIWPKLITFVWSPFKKHRQLQGFL